MGKLVVAIGVVVCLASTAHAERPRVERVPVTIDPAKISNVVNSKIIFLNRCAAGCTVTPGFSDSRTNKSAIGSGTLSAFSYGDATWSSVVACVTNMLDRFNVTVTDADPGPDVDHFEIMIAGTPAQIGLPAAVGGVAEYSCSSPGMCARYIPNALVFDFAGTWAGNVTDICSTAAQEIAHTWTLDHVVDATDPMTHFNFTQTSAYKDNVKCGSDCRGMTGVSPFGLTCTPSSNPAQPCPTNQPNCEHTCMSSGTAIQNDVQILLALFGPKGAVAPTLTVANPTNGSAQVPGFEITGDCSSSDGVQEVDISIDGVSKASLTTTPFAYTTPATLADGPHKITVLCASTLQATTTLTAQINVGLTCSGGACGTPGYVCFEGTCIAAPGTPGGLGATCTSNTDCKTGSCASDGATSACTIPCELDANNCPDGFGCLDTGGGGGVCWAGASGGGGCCDTSGGSGAGSMLLALGIAATFVTRRRRRSR
jgi:MYXO-CTERM domain-containing protein